MAGKIPIKGVIFDLDGTLADTLEDIRLCVNQTIATLDRPSLTSSDIRPMIGNGVREMLRRASQIEDPEALNQIVATYRSFYADGMLKNTRLYPGVPSLLDRLESARTSMCILSNKSHEFTKPICDELLRGWSIFAVQGSTDEALRKPNPTHAVALAERMQLAPASIAFVGDSPTDIATARNAGMIAIAVTWGYRNRQLLVDSKPDHLIETVGELTECLVS